MNPIVAAFKYDQYMLPGEPLKRHKHEPTCEPLNTINRTRQDQTSPKEDPG